MHHHPFHQMGFSPFPLNPFLAPNFLVPPSPILQSPGLPNPCVQPNGQRLPATVNSTSTATIPTLPPPFFEPPQLAQMRAVMNSMMQFYPGQAYTRAPNPFVCLPGQDIQSNEDATSEESQQRRRVLAAIEGTLFEDHSSFPIEFVDSEYPSLGILIGQWWWWWVIMMSDLWWKEYLKAFRMRRNTLMYVEKYHHHHSNSESTIRMSPQISPLQRIKNRQRRSKSSWGLKAALQMNQIMINIVRALMWPFFIDIEMKFENRSWFTVVLFRWCVCNAYLFVHNSNPLWNLVSLWGICCVYAISTCLYI